MKTLFPDMQSDALIDSSGDFRFWLSRTWDETLPKVLFIGLNDQ